MTTKPNTLSFLGEEYEIDPKWGLTLPKLPFKLEGLTYSCGGSYVSMTTTLNLLEWAALTSVYPDISIENAKQRPVNSKHAKDIEGYIALNKAETFLAPIILNYPQHVNVKPSDKRELKEVTLKETLFSTDGQHRLSAVQNFLKGHLELLSPNFNEEKENLTNYTPKELAEKLKHRLTVHLILNADQDTLGRIFGLQANSKKISALFTARIKKTPETNFLVDSLILGKSPDLFPKGYLLSNISLWKVTADDPIKGAFPPPFDLAQAQKAISLTEKIFVISGAQDIKNVLWVSIFDSFAQLPDTQKIVSAVTCPPDKISENESTYKAFRSKKLVAYTSFAMFIKFIAAVHAYATEYYIYEKTKVGVSGSAIIPDLADYKEFLTKKVHPLIKNLNTNLNIGNNALKQIGLLETTLNKDGVEGIRKKTQEAPIRAAAKEFCYNYGLLDPHTASTLGYIVEDDLDSDEPLTQTPEQLSDDVAARLSDVVKL